MDSVEESSLPPNNQHSLPNVEEDVPPKSPSSDQYVADAIHHVEEVDTIQEATKEAIESSDKRSSKPLRPSGGVELGIVHMPLHLQNKDPMWSANEMRLL